jgi:hypothetical protein
MTTPSRLVMALAMHGMGTHRGMWAQAMLAEFAVAEADGRPFRFAFGCLIGAWRTLPQHDEGRFALAGYGLSLGLLLPVAGVLTMAALLGLPFSETGDGIGGFLSGSGPYRSLLNPGTLAAGPALTLALLLLALCHLPVAWWVVEHDWPRVTAALCFGASAMTTLGIATGCTTQHVGALLLPFTLLAIEFAAVSALAWSHTARSGSCDG